MKTVSLKGKALLTAQLYGQAIPADTNLDPNQFTFEIAGKMPSLNEYDSQHTNFRVAGRMKKHWTELVAAQAGIAAQGRRYQRIEADIQWIEPNKRRDKDNISFAKKFIFDGLVLAQIIPNDGWNNIERWSESFSVDSANPRIVVTVIDAIPYTIAPSKPH